MRVRVLIGLDVGIVALIMPTTAEATSCEGTTPSDVVVTGTAVSVRNPVTGAPAGASVIRRMLLVVPALMLLSWMHVSPAGADCAAEPTASGGIASADVVFVGTVVDLHNSGRYATFAVEEGWKGSAADEVTVHGGPPDPSGDEFVTSSAERRYELGQRYLVTAYDNDIYTGASGVLSDNSCSGTTVWTNSLAGLRPTDASIIERDQPIEPRTKDSSPPYGMIILTTVLVAGGCLYLLFRRGSIAYRAREDDEPPSKS